ncbi:hypothetical protein Gpo141_00004952 [Globisporangium polare]
MRISPFAPSVDLVPRPPDTSSSRSTQPSATGRLRAKSLELSLSPRIFRWIWLLLLSFHALYAATTLGISWLYFFISSPNEAYKYNSMQISVTSQKRSGISFAVLAAAHGVMMMRIVYYSLSHKRLLFRKPVERHRPSTTTNASSLSQIKVARALYALWRLLRRSWDAVYGGNGYFGLNGSHFDTGFEVREAFEILMQTYQAMNLSRLVPKRWINSLAVAAIVLNCGMTPLAHVIFRRELPRRLFCRVADMLLDSCCSLVIPFCIFYPYWRAYNPVTQDFPPELYFDDVWYVNAIAEGRQILITSVVDYISTLAPHVSILSCLITIESLLQRAPPSQDDELKATATSGPSVSPSSDPGLSKRQQSRSRQMRFLVHLVFLAWGFFVAFVHLYAQFNSWSDTPGCKLHVNAWFTTMYPCSVMEVNCYRRQQMTGDSDQIALALEDLERFSLRTLIITHCPVLHVPPVIQEFSSLGGIEIFNCSIASWGYEAAIREGFNSKLTYALIMFSNVSGIPEALLHRDLPQGFSHLVFYQTNLTEIPDNLDKYWKDHEWVILAFAGCNLSSIPVTIAELSLVQLVLEQNNLEFIPDVIFEHRHFTTIDLSYNPLLHALPDLLGSDAEFFDIVAANTSLRSVPNWLREWVVAPTFPSSTLYNTPFCDALLNASGSSGGNNKIQKSGDEVDPLAREIVAQLCTNKDMTLLALDIILPQRQP